ncbi:alpha-crystallin A chain-like isoform X2 [Homalodisca vitripennis]|uniref:alpha-crystallin A chain-like isoform X2 n=1 Tax=Homalodisca vitripennis TaxID=197043 RepID=UPI001EEB81A5|nr:alpha-crystallin A chain-like isoform X2 [Homalodisca vitripennis]
MASGKSGLPVGRTGSVAAVWPKSWGYNGNDKTRRSLYHCLQMLVDVKGFHPFNMKLNVNEEVVELIASQEEASNNPATTRGQNCVGYMARNISRKYILPQKLVKECVQCSLSADGILFIMAPWLRC